MTTYRDDLTLNETSSRDCLFSLSAAKLPEVCFGIDIPDAPREGLSFGFFRAFLDADASVAAFYKAQASLTSSGTGMDEN